MASHTFCRAKPVKQQSCSATTALAIVQDLLANSTSNLADDVRGNLYKIESDLQVLQGFPEDSAHNGTTGRQHPAATSGKAVATAAGGAAPGSKKKGRKEDGNRKEPKDGAAAEHGVQEPETGRQGLGKRKAEKGKDDDGKEKRKKKKQKAGT